MKSFQDKVVVITGAASGIGRALAIRFAQLGAKLALNDFKADGLEATLQLLPPATTVMTAVFDVSQKEAMYEFAADVAAKYGRVDVMINNAGVAIARFRTDEVSIADYEWIIGINLWGMIYGSLAFLPHLRSQPESALVNVSSIFGLHGIPGQSPYVTTKFAIRGFTESLELEEKLHKTGLTVSSVHPGGIKTNIVVSAKGADAALVETFEQASRTTPDQAARIIIRGIQRKKSRILVGLDAHAFHFLVQRMRFAAKWVLNAGYRKALK